MGPTNWHSDLRMTPLDTNDFVTFWLPLRDLQAGEEDSGMLFAQGSHRDFAFPFWHDVSWADASCRGYRLASTGILHCMGKDTCINCNSYGCTYPFLVTKGWALGRKTLVKIQGTYLFKFPFRKSYIGCSGCKNILL
jgi:hypothetical protein